MKLVISSIRNRKFVLPLLLTAPFFTFAVKQGFAADISSIKVLSIEIKAPHVVSSQADRKAAKHESEKYRDRGQALIKTGQYEQAEVELKQAIKIDPDSSSAHYYLGESYYSRGRHADALKEYDQAIKLRPDRGSYYYYRGLVRADLKDHKAAIVDFTSAIKYAPGKDRVYKTRGTSYFKLKMYDKAIADFKTSLELNPQLVATKLAIAECLSSDEKNDEAISYCTEYIKDRPHDARGYAARAKVYAKTGKKDLAAKDVQTANEEGDNFSL